MRRGLAYSLIFAIAACLVAAFASLLRGGKYHHAESVSLDPLPIERLWGVGRQCSKVFQRLGIRTIGQLRQWPLESLQARFGSGGEYLWQLAHGIDDRAVVPERDAKVSIHIRDPFAQPRYPAMSYCERGKYIAEFLGAKDHLVVPYPRLLAMVREGKDDEYIERLYREIAPIINGRLARAAQALASGSFHSRSSAASWRSQARPYGRSNVARPDPSR